MVLLTTTQFVFVIVCSSWLSATGSNEDPYEEYRRQYESNLGYDRSNHHQNDNNQQNPQTTEPPTETDPDIEYQRRLEEYRRQLADYERNLANQQTTEPPVDMDDYQKRLQEHYRQLNQYASESQPKQAAAPTTTQTPFVDRFSGNYGSGHPTNDRKDSYKGNMNQLVEHLPFAPQNQLCVKPVVPNGFMKWMDAERPSYTRTNAYSNGKFVFECDEGYERDFNGPPLEVFCRSGHLTALPRCKRIQVCSGIPKPTHGVVDLPQSRILDAHRPNMFRIGTVFTFRCNQYAKPDPGRPQMQSTCVDGGIWSNYPKCVAATTCDFNSYLNFIQKPNIQLVVVYRNVTIMKSPVHHGNYHVIVGSTVKHRCTQGYSHDPHSGPMDVTCQPNGHWTSFPNCELIGEVKLTDMSHGNINLCCDRQDEFKAGCPQLPDSAVILRHNLIPRVYKISQAGGYIIGNITFVCKENYEPPEIAGEQMTISCRGGTWTDMPQCSLRRLCSTSVNLPPNAEVTGSKLFFIPGLENDGYLPGSFISYTCRSTSESRGFVVKSGQISCLKEGRWDHPAECNQY